MMGTDKQKPERTTCYKGKLFAWLLWFMPLVLGVMAAPDASSAAANNIGTFTIVAGSVDALREQNDAPIAAEIGMDAFLQDVVRTKHRSRTQLRFIDDSVLNMGANHMVKIKDYVYDEENGVRKAILSTLRGTVRVTVSKLGGDGESVFEVETPTAVASVRGTDFIVKVNSSLQTEIFVLEGTVAVRNINPKIKGLVMVKAGQKTSIAKNKPPTAAISVPVQMQEVLIAETTPTATGKKTGGVSAQQNSKTGGNKTQQATGEKSLAQQPAAPAPELAAIPVAPPPPAPVALASPRIQPVIVAQQTKTTTLPPVQPPVTTTVPALITVPVTLNLVF